MFDIAHKALNASVLAALLTVAVVKPGCGQDADALRGLSALSVQFILDDDLEGVIDESAWRTRVEQELTSVGVSVTDAPSESARAFLVVAVLALPTTSRGLAYHLQISVRDVVRRADDGSGRQFYAYTWQTGGIATVSRAEAGDHLTSFMLEFLDEFLNAYRMVNAG